MSKILVTNDDGIHSKGIIALAEALERLGEVVVVAPAHEMSAASHSLTLMRPLRIEKIDERHYAIDGTPIDCVSHSVTLACTDPIPPACQIGQLIDRARPWRRPSANAPSVPKVRARHAWAMSCTSLLGVPDSLSAASTFRRSSSAARPKSPLA